MIRPSVYLCHYFQSFWSRKIPAAMNYSIYRIHVTISCHVKMKSFTSVTATFMFSLTVRVGISKTSMHRVVPIRNLWWNFGCVDNNFYYQSKGFEMVFFYQYLVFIKRYAVSGMKFHMVPPFRRDQVNAFNQLSKKKSQWWWQNLFGFLKNQVLDFESFNWQFWI